MKRILSLIALSLISFIGFSQTKGISYQAVIIDPNPIEIPGKDVVAQPYVSKDVWIRFGIYAGTTLQYEELHKTKTDEYGLVNLIIGGGVNTGKAGTFTSLSWDGITKNIVTNVSFDQGGRYTEVSNQKLNYVPYTLLAETAVKLAGVLPIASGGTGATNAIAARTNLGLGNVDNTADVDKPVSIATLAILDTKESLANKSTNIIADSASIVKYPSVKAIKDYVDARTSSANNANLAAKATALETPRTINGIPFDGTANITIPVGVTPPDANATTKGLVKLAGDLTGTADAPAIAAAAVTTAKIADGAVTDGKITSVSGSKVTGNITGNAANVTGTVAIANGGTGATTASGARTNLGLAIGTDVLAQRTFGTAANSAATDFVAVTEKGANNGVATLGVNGKIPSVQIPSISFQSVSVVNSDATMTAIAGAQVGSIAIRSDLNINYVLSALPATTLSNWIQLAASTDVSTINGIVGPSVNLTTNEIPEGNTNKYYTDARVRGALSATGPLALNASTGVISMTAASGSSDGYLSSADFTTFNNKQTALTAGVDYATPSGNITGNAANVTGIVAIANGGTGASTAGAALTNLGAEPTSNKSNDILVDGSSTTKFPTFKAIKDYVDQQSANAGVADNSITSAKINGNLAVLKGGTGASTAAGARTNLGLVIGTDVMAANATTALTGDVSGSGNGSFATTVNSVGGVSSSTIATLPGLITANTNAIAANTASITANATAIATNTTSIATNATAITSEATTARAAELTLTNSVNANTASITANTNSIATLNTNVAANTASITANTTAIAANTTSIATNATAITSEATTARAAELTLTNSVNANTASITANANSIATLNTNVSANTTSITANSTDIATINTNLALIAPLASPTFTGTPTAPTPATSDNSTALATTEYVKASITAANAGLSSIGAISGTSNAKGATISGTTELILTPADATNGGVVTTGAQTFAGSKTFTNTVTFGKNITVNGMSLGTPTNSALSPTQNTIFGVGVLSNYAPSLSSHDYNTGIGFKALFNQTLGGRNTATGASALYALTTGKYNSGYGQEVLVRLTNGSFNTAVGNTAGGSLINTSDNTMIGAFAGNNVTGSNNIFLGSNNSAATTDGSGITTGSNNTIIGSGIRGLAATLSNNIVLADGQGNIRAQHDGTTGWTLGTISSGTWSGTTIDISKGGTGATTAAAALTNLGAEATANKSTDLTADANSTLKYPSVKLIKDYVDTRVASAGVTDGSITNAKLAGSITASNLVGTDITTVGTITSGTWSASVIDIAHGGTGSSTVTGAKTNLGLNNVENTALSTWTGSTNITTVGALTAQTKTFMFQDLILGYGANNGAKIQTDASNKYLSFYPNINVESTRMWPSGNVTIQTGGTFTDNGYKLEVGGTTNLIGNTTITGTLSSTGTISSAAGFTGPLTGNASTATALAAGKTISLTGDVAYTSGSFDGSSNVTGSATLTNTTVTAGAYGSSTAIPTFTVDGKGRLTAAGTVGITAGVSTLAYSTTGSSNGGTISGTTLTLTAADATNPGLVSTGTQTIAGAKTFNSDVTATNFLGNATTATTAGNITATSNTSLTSLANLATVGTITSGVWSGTVISSNKGGAGTVSGLLKANGSGVVSAAVAGTDYQAPLTAGTSFIAPNAAITAATKTKITYDAFGLVTTGADATTADIAPSTNRNYVTDAQAGVISNTSGINTGDETASTIKTKLGIATLSGSNTGDQTITLTGDLTGSGTGSFAATLTNTTVTVGSYGSSTSIPTLTVDSKGRLTAAGSASIIADAGTLTGTSLNATVTGSSLTGVATITSGTWNGSTIGVAYGGTGLTSPGTSGNLLTSNGTGWVSSAPTWVSSLGTFTTTSYAKGGTISGTVLTLSAADATNPGLVTTGVQTFAGAKTFSGTTTFNSDVTINGLTVGAGKVAASNNSVFGISALPTSTPGIDNAAFGYQSLNKNTGNYNSAFGSTAGFSNTSGSNNAAFGLQALYMNSTSGFNSAFGTNAGYSATGADNVFLGYGAGFNIGAATKNIFLGSNSGVYYGSGSTGVNNTLGDGNVMIGYDVRPSANSQTNQIVISGYNGTAGTIGLGSNSTLIGSTTTMKSRIYGALTVIPNTATSGAGNSSTIAAQDGYSTGNNAGGALNLTAGNGYGTGNGGNINLTPGTTGTGTAGKVIVNGGDMIVNTLTVGSGKGSDPLNTALGVNALVATTGVANTAIGNNALAANTSGASNTAIGYQALLSITSGSSNISVGNRTNYINQTGSDNIAIGADALFLNTASSNIGLGSRALYKNTSGINNTAIGINSNGGNQTGSNNTSLGYKALYTTGTNSYSDNTAIGYYSMGGGSTATGGTNTLVGSQTGYSFTSAAGNVAMGYNAMYFHTAGDYNTSIGNSSGPNTTTYSNTNAIYLGYAARPKGTAASTDEIVIGANTSGNGSNTVTIGNSANTANYLSGVTNVNTGTLTATTGFNLTGSVNDFLEYNVKNSSTGTSAQSGYNAMANNGTDAVNFAWMGINNSTFSNPQTYNIGGANDVSFLGGGNDMYVANANTSKSIIFSTGTATTPYFSEKMRITATGNVGIGTASPTATLEVNGTTRLGGATTIAGAATFTSTVTITSGAGAGKVLTSDATGGATWKNSGGTITTTASSATISTTDSFNYIIFTGSTASQTITLPSASLVGAGREFTIKNVASVSVSIGATAGYLIQDNTTLTSNSASLGIEPSNNWMKLVSDGTNWYIMRALF